MSDASGTLSPSTPASLVRIEVVDRIATVTIQRPEKLNALNDEVLAALGDAFAALEKRDDVAVVLVTGAGEKAFVAGADIGALVTMTPLSGVEVARRGQAVFQRIERFPRPVVAVVNGFALGGGCELALACHIRIASSTARFGLPEVGLGIIPGYGGTVRLARVVGLGRAVELTLTGRMVRADEAERIGLVTRVVEPDALGEAARELAAGLAARGPLALARALESIYHAQDVSAADAYAHEAALFGLLAASDDMREGMGAFLEKRTAEFRGR
jgi:enoyl-CoA hydratase